VQGLALILGLAALTFVVLRTEGLQPFAGLTAAELIPLGSEPRPLLEIVEEWAIPVVGSMVAAELVARILAARSGAVARNATVVAGTSYLLIGLMPVGLGLAGAALLPGLAEPEQILPLLAQQYLPTALYVLFAGGLVSAILSTVDSALLMAGGLVSHNVIVQVRPDLSERAKVRVARAAVCLFGVVAYVMALRADRVYELVEEASAFGSSGMVVVVCFGLFTRIGGKASALTAMLVGVASWIIGAHVAAWPYPYLTSLAAATAAYLTVAALGSAAVNVLEPLEA
jgi:Na+/proline symporter